MTPSPRKRWTSHEELALLVELEAGTDYESLAQAFGTTRRAVEVKASKLRSGRFQGLDGVQEHDDQQTLDLDDEAQPDHLVPATEYRELVDDFDAERRAAQRLRDRNLRLGQLDRGRYRLENGLDLLAEAIARHGPSMRCEPLAPRPPSAGKAREDLLVHFTDWHGMEAVKGSTVLHLNAVTGDVFCDRIQSITEQTAARIEELAATRDVRRCVIAWGGDMSAGLIHDLDRYNADGQDAVTALLNVAAVLARATADIAAACHRHGIEVLVVGVTGNHGRLRPDTPMQNTSAPRESLDWACYAMAAALLRDTGIRQIYLPEALYALVELCGQTGLIVHGDLMARASGGNADRLLTTMQRLAQALHLPIDFALGGHFHHYAASNGRAFLTASTKGTDTYVLHLLQCQSSAGQGLLRVTETGRIYEPLLAGPVATAQYRMRWTDTVGEPAGRAPGRPYILGAA
jgi:GTP cyclohydrolase II